MESAKPNYAAPELSAQDFHALKRLFNEVAGLRFDAGALPLFRRRLASRLPLHELGNYRDYLKLLSRGAESVTEISAALDLLTSGETYFFRHEEQLELLSQTILPALAEANAKTRHLSIWSAGCSSGEEVYTLAILLTESGLFEGWNVRILGSDLSHERIEHARQGCYFKGAFRTTDPKIWKRHFQQVGKVWQVHESLRNMCRFAPLNLMGSEIDYFVGRVDLVLCRNVLIYLDDVSRRRVLQNINDHLVAGGFLLLGHSESLKFVDSPLDLISLQQDLAFRKPTRATRRGNP
jgi:chemotaxis protein methyltransferase CheR